MLKLYKTGILKSLKMSARRISTVQKYSTKKESSSSSSSSSDDEKKSKSAEAKRKLNLLLNRMIEEDVTKKQPILQLAKAKDRRKRDVRSEPGTQSVKKEPIEALVQAVKEVAHAIGGDKKQTESELLQKLLNPVKPEPSAKLSDIFKNMKVDTDSQAPEQLSRARQVEQLLQSKKATERPKVTRRVFKQRVPEGSERPVTEERINLFEGERLNVFDPEEVAKWDNPEMNETWKTLHERELRLAVIHPPKNYFQQMILWTEQGKLWKFPIDNEQGLEEESKVSFTEHVFLEKHLEPWCSAKGPVRHFMELVCVGLSKNPYLTVEKKREHIEWYKNYFEEKKKLLHDTGALPASFDVQKSEKIKEQ